MSETFAAGFAALDQMIQRAADRRAHELAQGHTEDEFISGLIGEFCVEAQRHPAGSGAAHMALSLVRLTDQLRQIAELEAALAMRDSALNILWALSDKEIQ